MIDSWAWIEYFKGTALGQRAKPFVEGNDEILVSSLNVAEVYLFCLRHRPNETNSFIGFLLKSSFVIPPSTEMAIDAAKHKHEKKMGMTDAIIYSTAQKHGARIVTGDDDFKGMEGVEYIGK